MLSARCIKFPRSFFLPQNCEILDMCGNIFCKSWTFLTKIYCCSVAEVLVGKGPWRKTIVMETVWWILSKISRSPLRWICLSWWKFPSCGKKTLHQPTLLLSVLFSTGTWQQIKDEQPCHWMSPGKCKALSEYKKMMGIGSTTSSQLSVFCQRRMKLSSYICI